MMDSDHVSLWDWGVYRKALSLVQDRTCGQLCSLRWTWLSPQGDAALVYTGVLAHLLKASEWLAGGKLLRLHLEPVPGVPACFALAAFEGGAVAEVEIHEALPSPAPAVRFLMADFTGGRVTNRPLVGHHHAEGAFLAVDGVMQALHFEPLPVVRKALNDETIQEAIARALGGIKR